MAILLVARELLDQRELREMRNGWRGKRVYYVTTQDVEVATFGNTSGKPVGLPEKGSAWDTTRAPYLVCVERDFRREGGVDSDAVNITGGFSEVTLTYETLGLHGRLPPPKTGLAFTRLVPTVTGVQALYGIDPNTGSVPDGAKQIADGQGAPKDVGLVAYEVFRPLSPQAFGLLDVPRLVTLHTEQAVNSDQVTLPAYLASARADAYSPGQLRFAGFAVDDPDETGWRYLRVGLAAAVDHRVYWTAQGEGGDASAAEYAVDIYRHRPFTGLW